MLRALRRAFNRRRRVQSHPPADRPTITIRMRLGTTQAETLFTAEILRRAMQVNHLPIDTVNVTGGGSDRGRLRRFDVPPGVGQEPSRSRRSQSHPERKAVASHLGGI